jgi:hypothetical protein
MLSGRRARIEGRSPRCLPHEWQGSPGDIRPRSRASSCHEAYEVSPVFPEIGKL